MATYAELERERADYVARTEVKLSQLYEEDRRVLFEQLKAGLNFGRADPEADGKIRLLEKMNLISAGTFEAPGSSGGPVLDRYGRCVGMITRWLEKEWEKERARFSAAIPVVLIKEAIEEAQASHQAAR